MIMQIKKKTQQDLLNKKFPTIDYTSRIWIKVKKNFICTSFIIIIIIVIIIIIIVSLFFVDVEIVTVPIN